MGKLEIVCYALGVLFLGVGLTVALTAFQDAWKANEHVRWLVSGSIAAAFVLSGILVGGLPLAHKADAEKATSKLPDPLEGVKELLREQTVAQQRSYVQIDNFALAVGAEFTEIIFRVTVDGPTPIDIESGEIRISIDDPPLSPEARRLGLYTAKITPQRITPRQQSIQRVRVAKLPAVHQQRLLKGPATEVFYVGEIRYWDAFRTSGTKKHRREFAYGMSEGRMRPLDMVVWARNNETDDPEHD